MSVKLLTEHHWRFLSLKGGCAGLSESTPVKKPHCWKSHVAAQLSNNLHFSSYNNTAVKPVLSGHSKIDKKGLNGKW